MIRPNLTDVKLSIYHPLEDLYKKYNVVSLSTPSTQYRSSQNWNSDLFFKPSDVSPDTNAIFYIDGAEHKVNNAGLSYVDYRRTTKGNMREVYRNKELTKGLVVVSPSNVSTAFTRLQAGTDITDLP